MWCLGKSVLSQDAYRHGDVAVEVCWLVSDGPDGLNQFYLFGWQFTCYHGCRTISLALTIYGLFYSHHLIAKTCKWWTVNWTFSLPYHCCITLTVELLLHWSLVLSHQNTFPVPSSDLSCYKKDSAVSLSSNNSQFSIH